MEEIDNNYGSTSTPAEVKPENPMAFPGIAGESGHGNVTRTQAADGETVWVYHNQGMTLRDYFAAAALQGMLASGHETAIEKASTAAGGDPIRGLALASYGMADAMLKARSRD
jgi:hypothetical protein